MKLEVGYSIYLACLSLMVDWMSSKSCASGGLETSRHSPHTRLQHDGIGPVVKIAQVLKGRVDTKALRLGFMRIRLE